MQSEHRTTVLEYHRPQAHQMIPRTVWLIVFSAIPFLIEVAAILWEGATGDPPNNLGEFKAYHYAIATAVIAAIAWLLWTVRRYRGANRWMLLIL
jgi:hypothetical protein